MKERMIKKKIMKNIYSIIFNILQIFKLRRYIFLILINKFIILTYILKTDFLQEQSTI